MRHRVEAVDILEIDGEKRDLFTVDHIVLRIKLTDETEFWLNEGLVMDDFVVWGMSQLPSFDVDAYDRLYPVPFEQITCTLSARR